MSNAFSVPEAQTGAPHLPLRAANTPFLLAFVRDSWVYCEDGKIRPLFRVHPFQPGINAIGNTISKDPGAQYEVLKASCRKWGQVPLDINAGHPEYGGYCVSIRAFDPGRRREGLYWQAAWVKAMPQSEREVIDWARFDQYLAMWAERGVLPVGPPEDLVHVKVRELEVRLGNARARDPRGEGHKYRETERELKAWQALLDAGAVDVAPEPTPAPPPRGEPEPELAEPGPLSIPPASGALAGVMERGPAPNKASRRAAKAAANAAAKADVADADPDASGAGMDPVE